MKIKATPKRDRLIVEVAEKDEKLLAHPAFELQADPRFRLKKILVPVDFSPCSLKALQYAMAFARHFGAGLLLLHVVQVNYIIGEFGPVDFPVFEKDLEQSARRQLEALARELALKQTPVETMLCSGLPWNEIVNAATKTAADLIIIATHGHTGLKHVLMGSTTTNVVRHAPCPVLTVREHEHEFVNP